MAARQRKYDREEHARRGKEWYEKIRPKVEPGNQGKFLAIDIDTGEYEMSDTPLDAAHRLLERLPDAQIWGERIGYPGVFTLGLRFSTPPT